MNSTLAAPCSNAARAPLCLTLGDPSGCGPQITVRAWQQLRDQSKRVFYVHGRPELYSGIPVAAIGAPHEAEEVFTRALPVIPVQAEMGEPIAGEPDPKSAPATIESIVRGVEDVMSGKAGALVTNPISKALLNRAGFRHPGHTEYLAELTGSGTPPVMMLVGGGLRVALASVHLSLRKAIDELSVDGLITTARTVAAALKRDFLLAKPRLVFTGLNPHAGEDGMLGSEEREVINPAAEALRKSGLDVANARPADTVFAEALNGKFDAIIAMTHDQGLIPVKTLDMWGGVNTTLGLPIIRTSPDHGTAYDAARAGSAKPDSLIAAVGLACEMAAARQAGAHVQST